MMPLCTITARLIEHEISAAQCNVSQQLFRGKQTLPTCLPGWLKVESCSRNLPANQLLIMMFSDKRMQQKDGIMMDALPGGPTHQ
jgi:hypothetical protein